MTNAIPLISSQRFLDMATVMRKARTFKAVDTGQVVTELLGIEMSAA